ncbi:bifunctional riboflavin kinase/FAD synthetase [Limisalsivibrio acetivorans]|uniref:bifunctional riboflavin kinase/FAD synthetase n=1 Tax=Limisalsivibrio acetivorans TaxID=1304888 RepID=UPI0003B41487|nr:bifunctional riboflavin kinase/FAD synthetase [Limisalsivibrio acetivorans]
MRIVRDIETYTSAEPYAVSLGNFDGLHLGHMKIIDTLKSYSAKRGLKNGVITFSPHPMKYFGMDLRLIMQEKSKARILEDAGIDILFNLSFSKKLADIDPELFVREFLVKKLRAVSVIVGHDYRFGQKRKGDYDLLKRLGEKYGFTAVRVPKVTAGEYTVSSTNIRRFLKEGNVVMAEKLLGRPFFLEGKIETGDSLGRKLGFPTANLNTDNELIPKTGVYAARMYVDGQRFDGVTNIGSRPTFNFPDNVRIETHLFDFDGDLYEKEVCLELIKYIREEERFSSPEELAEVISKDCGKARTILGYRE